MFLALGAFIFVATIALGCLLEKAEHCRGCGRWFKFDTHQFGHLVVAVCRACGNVKEMQ